MLNLMMNVSGSIAIIGNIFLLTVLFFVSRNKNDTGSKIGFWFLKLLTMLNIFMSGGMLWIKL